MTNAFTNKNLSNLKHEKLDWSLVQIELKNYEKSVFHYEKALQIKPDSAITYSNIGNVHRLLGN